MRLRAELGHILLCELNIVLYLLHYFIWDKQYFLSPGFKGRSFYQNVFRTLFKFEQVGFLGKIDQGRVIKNVLCGPLSPSPTWRLQQMWAPPPHPPPAPSHHQPGGWGGGRNNKLYVINITIGNQKPPVGLYICAPSCMNKTLVALCWNEI